MDIIAELEKALQGLEKCTGLCKQCSKCHIYTSGVNGKPAIYYAFGCDLLPRDEYGPISDTMRDLHAAALEVVKFEMRVNHD